MPFDSNGIFSLDPGYIAVIGQTIQPSQHNPPLEDIITNGLSMALVRDGRAPMVGPLNMNTFKVTGAGAGTAAGDLVNKEQLDAKVNVTGGTLVNPLGEFLRGYMTGLGLANSGANDIIISAGAAASDGAPPAFMPLAAQITKRLNAFWAVGSGNGGLDTGTVVNGTYFVWLIRRPDTGVTDALFSLSPTAPTMPAGYTQKRRIGAIIKEPGAILPFVQSGNEFRIASTLIYSASATAAIALLVVASTPVGISVDALIHGDCSTSSVGAQVALSAGSSFSNPISGSLEVRGFAYAAASNTGALISKTRVRTDTLARIYRVVSVTGGTGSANLYTSGWIDPSIPALI